MKITGAKKHLGRLQKMRSRISDEAGQMVMDAATEHAEEAKRLIGAGSVSSGKHIPSQPGKPPRSDTGRLAESIHAERVGPLQAVSIADAPYASALEFGTSKIVERPFMRPAAKTVRKVIGDKARARVRRVTREV